MAKLYPPVIQGVLPAFYDIANVPIHFTMNRAVSQSQVSGFTLVLKEAESGKTVELKKKIVVNEHGKDEERQEGYSDKIDWNKNIVYFDLVESLKRYQNCFFKVQLAYNDQYSDIGYYSTVGLIKYTDSPEITIANLKVGKNNKSLSEYVGTYKNYDSTETPYQFRYIIFNDSQKEVYQGEWKLVFGQDGIKEKIPQLLEENKIYYITLEIQTINGLTASSPLYIINKSFVSGIKIQADLKVEVNDEDGYVNLFFEPWSNIKDLAEFLGNYIICRTSADNDYKIWEDLTSIEIDSVNNIKTEIFRDFSALPSKKYKYGIKKYNNHNIYSMVKETDPILVQYSHIYFYDGDKQLKLSFNPVVTSLTKTLQETKHNVLGRKYPIFMRSGLVNFKEFQLTATGSYLNDENFIFIDKQEDIYKYTHEEDLVKTIETYTYVLRDENYPANYPLPFRPIAVHTYGEKVFPFNTNPSLSNYSIEKNYRDKVIEFLTNGKPKLYKSAAEGGLIVQTSEVSYTPNEQLARLIGDFDCTVTEVAECTQEKLQELGIIKDFEIKLRSVYHNYTWVYNWDEKTQEYQLYDPRKNIYYSGYNKNLLDYIWEKGLKMSSAFKATDVKIEGANPGTIFKIGDNNIAIGITGELNLNNIDVKHISLYQKGQSVGINRPIYVTVGYHTHNFYGTTFDITYESNYHFNLINQYFGPCDLVGQYTNQHRNTLIELGNINIEKKQIIDITQEEFNAMIEKEAYDYISLYHIIDSEEDDYYNFSLSWEQVAYSVEAKDEKFQPCHKLTNEEKSDMYNIKIAYTNQELEDTITLLDNMNGYSIPDKILLNDPNRKITSFSIGAGLMATCFESWGENKRLDDPDFYENGQEIEFPENNNNFDEWSKKYWNYIYQYQLAFKEYNKEGVQ